MKKIIIILTILILVKLTAKATTYYVSKTGNDTNNGSLTNPFLTISKAASIAVAGDTIYVYEGVYRERVAPPRSGTAGNPIVYMGEPNKNVFIKGSDIWQPTWSKVTNGIYKAVPNDNLFNDDAYVDDKNPFKVISSATPYGRNGSAEVSSGYPGDPNLSYTCGQVFVDGKMYIQKPFLSEMQSTAKSWYYDKQTGEINIHFSDDLINDHVVEISTRRRIFAPHLRRLSYITVQGFIMEHCGNQYPKDFWVTSKPQWQQAGAIGTRSGRYWVIKNNVIRFANGVGIDFGNEGSSLADLERGTNGLATASTNHIIDANYITDNGACGTAAYFPKNLTFTNNVVERNNNLLYTGQKRWESGGVKMHGPTGALIAYNMIRNNNGERGLWLDQGSGNDTKVIGNLIVGNECGFDLEIGSAYAHKLLLLNNVFINNNVSIAARESGGVTAMHNLIMGSTKSAFVNLISVARPKPWSSKYFYFFNNLLLKNESATLPFSLYSGALVNGDNEAFDRRLDYNYYQLKTNAPSNENFFTITSNNGSYVTNTVNFNSWKSTWNTINSGQYYDNNSNIYSLNDITSSYSDANTSLTITLNNTTNIVNTFSTPTILPSTTVMPDLYLKDYNKNDITVDGYGKPGPFQNLAIGTNTFQLWNGIRLLDVYENPNATALPLSLIDFKGKVANGKVNLEWLTINEVNVANFQLEKSVDGKNFKKIHECSANNTKQLSSYNFSDDAKQSGTFYYRLKMNDSNGEFSYSNIIYVNISNLLKTPNAITKLYPNPANDKITVEYHTQKRSSLIIVNAIGHVVYETTIYPSKNQLEIDVSSLLAGTYFTIIKNDNIYESQKFIKL